MIACAICSRIGEPETSSTVPPAGTDSTACWSSSEPSTRIVSTGAPGAARTTLEAWYGSATSSAPEASPGSRSSSSSVQPEAGTPSELRISCATSSSVSRRGSTITTRSGGAASSQRSTAARISGPSGPCGKRRSARAGSARRARARPRARPATPCARRRRPPAAARRGPPSRGRGRRTRPCWREARAGARARGPRAASGRERDAAQDRSSSWASSWSWSGTPPLRLSTKSTRGSAKLGDYGPDGAASRIIHARQPTRQPVATGAAVNR